MIEYLSCVHSRSVIVTEAQLRAAAGRMLESTRGDPRIRDCPDFHVVSSIAAEPPAVRRANPPSSRPVP